MKRITATDFATDGKSIIDCANDVAMQTVRHLNNGENVVLSTKGLRGVSPSFFNVILLHVVDTLGPNWIPDRFSVETDTPTQKAVYERSLASAKTERTNVNSPSAK